MSVRETPAGPDAAPARYASGLAALVEAVERAHREHRVDPVFAGDEKIYAYGGNGTIAILSELGFAGLVEVTSPLGTARVAPDEEGVVRARVTAKSDATDAGEFLARAARAIDLYYARRYWSV